MHDEFAAAAIEHNTAIEINISCILLSPKYLQKFVSQYLEYIAYLQSQGAILSLASDCHTAHYEIDFEKAGEMIESAGIKNKFWCLEPRTEKIEAI
jgi:histidinol phosphatase-like PHP family hydrolase